LSEIFQSYLKTAKHSFCITTNQVAVKSISFIEKIDPDFVVTNLPNIMTETQCQLNEYFEEKRTVFELNLDPEGTEFQKKVWALLCQIPFGKTLSYAEMANKLGDPKVIRAAASANGKNPIAIIIPCHRVIGKNGDLVGYAGGLNRKKMLLDHENRVANGVLELF
jgi:methylated-DNA-[protein]-cysteine S-methyltransferase